MTWAHNQAGDPYKMHPVKSEREQDEFPIEIHYHGMGVGNHPGWMGHPRVGASGSWPVHRHDMTTGRVHWWPATPSAEQRIILALAGRDAPVMDGTYANGHDWCVLCSGEGSRVEDHDADCPWRMACEYRDRM